jgi:trigger factor
LKVTLEKLPESRVQLEIEVDDERLEKSLDKAYKSIAQRTNIPGFRKGKAPRRVVEKMFTREGLIREALDKLVPDVYNEAIAEQDVTAVDQPDLEILDMEPVRFKATVAVSPTVTLGDYHAIRVAAEEKEVTDEMLEEQLILVRRHHATQAPVERGVQWDDMVTGDVVGTVEDEPFVEDTDVEFPIREGQTLLLEGIGEAFIGMASGDEKEITIPVPDDFQVENLRGKDANFKLVVREVKEEVLPEEDDELAKMVNAEEFETIDDLRSRIREDMEAAQKRQSDADVREKAVDSLVEEATLDFPEVFVEREIDGLIGESVGTSQEAYQAHLLHIGKSAEEFRQSFRDAAEIRVKRSLVLGQFAEEESIEVGQEAIEAELDRLVEPMGDGPETAQLREMFASSEGTATIGRNLLTERTLKRLQAIASGSEEEEESE